MAIDSRHELCVPDFISINRARHLGSYRLKWRWWNNETTSLLSPTTLLSKLVDPSSASTAWRRKHLTEYVLDFLWRLKWYHFALLSVSGSIFLALHAALLALGLAFIKRDYSERERGEKLREFVVDLKAVEEDAELRQMQAASSAAMRRAREQLLRGVVESETGTRNLEDAHNSVEDPFELAAGLLFPVEAELLARVARKRAVHKYHFAAEFAQAKVLSTLRTRFGKRKTKLGDHKDIGVQVVPSRDYLEPCFCEPAQLHAVDALDTSGFVLLKNCLPPDCLKNAKRGLFDTESISPDTSKGLGWCVKNKDWNVHHGRPYEGRLFMNLRGSVLEQFLADWHKHWLPVCHKYLTSGDVEAKLRNRKLEDDIINVAAPVPEQNESRREMKTGDGDEVVEDEERDDELLRTCLRSPRLYVAEIMLVLNDVICPPQYWHTDLRVDKRARRGRKRGKVLIPLDDVPAEVQVQGQSLTVLIPLEDVPADAGMLEMLPGTHRLSRSDLPDLARSDTAVDKEGFLARFLRAFRLCCAVRGSVTPSDVETAVADLVDEHKKGGGNVKNSCAGRKVEDAGEQTEADDEKKRPLSTEERFDAEVAQAEREKKRRTWTAGDVLIYDSRLVKRGGESTNITRMAPTIMIRYERWDSRRIGQWYLHGHRIRGQRWKRFCGWYLERVFQVYRAV
eukprot:g9571.t1